MELNPIGGPTLKQSPSKLSASPEEKANWFSKLTYYWMSPILKLGYESPLDQRDLPPSKARIKANKIVCDFSEKWKRERARHPDDPKLLRALFRTFKSELFYSGICRFLGDQIIVILPVFLFYYLRFLQNHNSTSSSTENTRPEWLGIVLALAIFLLQALQVFLVNKCFEGSMIMGLNIRTSQVEAIFRKTLRLSITARQSFSNGTLMNMMSGDTSRLDLACQYIHYTWSAPIQILVTIGLLYWQIGVSCFAGLAVIAVAIPFQGWTTQQLVMRRKKINTMSDARVKLTQEILTHFKAIRLYAWERVFMKKLRHHRQLELRSIKWTLILRAVIAGVFQTVPVLAAIVALITHELLGQSLNSAVAFTTLSLFYVIRIPLLIIPVAFNQMADAYLASKRIGGFLAADEHENLGSTEIHSGSDMGDSILVLEDLNATWERFHSFIQSPPQFFLKDINLSIRKGSLVAIVGPVGCGKTSLLQAIMGEMKHTKGMVKVRGNISYCPQTSWIQNVTLRDNILFGSEMEKDRYETVINACALATDIAQLTDGDLTEMGEKGSNMSGGQKQRINLARTAFRQADIYLLDSPLNAVDSQVSSHIHENCIRGLLGKSTRIIVTHDIRSLPTYDHIIFMLDRQIVDHGSYTELVFRCPQFHEMVQMQNPIILTPDDNVNLRTKKRPRKGRKFAPSEKSLGRSTIATEERNLGQVAVAVYQEYLQHFGSPWFYAFVIFLLLISQISRVGNDYWITVWINRMIPTLDLSGYQLIYASLGIFQCAIMVLAGLVFATGSSRASDGIHEQAFRNILLAPMSWCDTQLMGRVVNRFSRDLDIVDMLLPDSLRVFAFTFGTALSILVTICVVIPILIIPLVPFVWMYWYYQHFYRKTSVDLKRIENVSRSSLFSFFAEVLGSSGLETIRSFNAHFRFEQKNGELLDTNNSSYYLVILGQRWLAIRIELISALLTLLTCLFGIYLRLTSDAGLVGLCVTYTLQVSIILTWCVKNAAEVESHMCSVERLLNYNLIQPEEKNDAFDDIFNPSLGSLARRKSRVRNVLEEIALSPTSIKVDVSNWPRQGYILFEKVQLRYQPHLPPVLNEVDFEIKPGERVGIVGRSGAGKTSIINAIFMLNRPHSGVIWIDQENIAEMPLSVLRRNISIIPQEPAIFTGTIRENLDPLNKCTDEQILSALETCQLLPLIANEQKLDTIIDEGLGLLSTGQKQLICLARAILRQNKILVLDEATASVDMATDETIQTILRTNFSHCTIITIAHRLNTILDYDKVLVLSKGHVEEFGPPAELLAAKGLFYDMLQEHELVHKSIPE